MRRALSHLLSDAGYAVEFAPDGQHAFDQLVSQFDAFDILITDHQMPRLDGLALVTRLRQTAFSGAIIIFSSGLSTQDRASYRALSVDSILTKPTDGTNLTKAIEAICNDARTNA
jgi:DNA-binding response OmpR family regulator